MLPRVTLLRHSIHLRFNSFRGYNHNHNYICTHDCNFECTWQNSLNRNGPVGKRAIQTAVNTSRDTESYEDNGPHEDHSTNPKESSASPTLFPQNLQNLPQNLTQTLSTLSSLPPSHLLSPSKLYKLIKHHTHPSRCSAGDVQGVYEGVLGFFLDRLCASGGRGLMGLNTTFDTDGKGKDKGNQKPKPNMTPHLLTQTLFVLDRVQDKGLLLSNRTIGMLLVLVGSVYSPFYVVRRAKGGAGAQNEDSIVGTTSTSTTATGTSTRGRRKPLATSTSTDHIKNKMNPTQTLTLLLALVQEPSYTAQNLHELVRFIRGVAVDRERGRGVWGVVVEAFREAREDMVVRPQGSGAVTGIGIGIGIGRGVEEEDGGEDVEEDREWNVLDDSSGAETITVDPDTPRYTYIPPLYMLPTFVEAAVRAGKVDDAFRMLGDAIALSASQSQMQSKTQLQSQTAHPKIIDAHLAFLRALRHTQVWDTEAYGRVLAGMAELEGVGGSGDSEVDVEVDGGEREGDHREEVSERAGGSEGRETPGETPHQSENENENEKEKENEKETRKEIAKTRKQNGKAANVRSKVLEEVTRQMVGVGDWEGAFAVWRGLVGGGSGSLDGAGDGSTQEQGGGGQKLGSGMYAVLFSAYGKMEKVFPPPDVISFRPALETRSLLGFEEKQSEEKEKQKEKKRRGRKSRAIEKQKTPEKETMIPSPRELYRYFSWTFPRPRSPSSSPSSAGSSDLNSPATSVTSSSTTTTPTTPSTTIASNSTTTTTTTGSSVYKNTQLLNVLLRGFMRQGDYPAALVVLRQFTDAGAEINHVTYYIIVKALVQRIWYECGIGRVVVPSSSSSFPSSSSSSSSPSSPSTSTAPASPSSSLLKGISVGTWTTRFLGTSPTHKPRLGMTLVNHILHHVSLEKFDVGQRVYPEFSRGVVEHDVDVDADVIVDIEEGQSGAGNKATIKPHIQGFNTIADPQRGGTPTTPTHTTHTNERLKQKYAIPTMLMMEHVHRPKPVGFVYERVPLERLLERAVWALCEDASVGVEGRDAGGEEARKGRKGGQEGGGNKAEDRVREIVKLAEEEMTR